MRRLWPTEDAFFGREPVVGSGFQVAVAQRGDSYSARSGRGIESMPYSEPVLDAIPAAPSRPRVLAFHGRTAPRVFEYGTGARGGIVPRPR